MSESAASEGTKVRGPREGTVRQAIWAEVLASSNDHIGTPRPFEEIPQVSDWDMADPWESHLGHSFRRGRTVLEAVSYDSQYWATHYCLNRLVDKEASPTLHAGLLLATKQLLQLVVFSRLTVTTVDPHWNMPNLGDVFSTLVEMRTELGVTKEALHAAYQEHSYWTTPAFPGVTETSVVDRVMSGQVRVGNAEQPIPVLYRP